MRRARRPMLSVTGNSSIDEAAAKLLQSLQDIMGRHRFLLLSAEARVPLFLAVAHVRKQLSDDGFSALRGGLHHSVRWFSCALQTEGGWGARRKGARKKRGRAKKAPSRGSRKKHQSARAQNEGTHKHEIPERFVVLSTLSDSLDLLDPFRKSSERR